MDTFNKFAVGSNGSKVVVTNPPRGPISNEDAINLATWLLIVVGDVDCKKAKQIIEGAL